MLATTMSHIWNLESRLVSFVAGTWCSLRCFSSHYLCSSHTWEMEATIAILKFSSVYNSRCVFMSEYIECNVNNWIWVIIFNQLLKSVEKSVKMSYSIANLRYWVLYYISKEFLPFRSCFSILASICCSNSATSSAVTI